MEKSGDEDQPEDQSPEPEEEVVTINPQTLGPRQLLLELNMSSSSGLDAHRNTNSPAELQLLSFSNNFQRQFSHVCPERHPLLLCPQNECGIQKFVSTTLRPTAPVDPQLYTWDGCAEFVANFLSLEPLDPPYELPKLLISPSAAVHTQRATCFEFATLLCSLLLGANYDAYCVSGYASRELCLLDRSLQDCPLQDTPVQRVISEEKLEENRYTMQPQRELKSRFITAQEKKKQEAEEARLRSLNPEENEQRPDDPLRGLRVHCWVLVLAGSRSIHENFFIDPLSGASYSLDAPDFLGIESVWNNLNYYVNMQACSTGCGDMSYDLDDITMWEPLLFGATSKKLLIYKALNRKLTRGTEMIEEVEDFDDFDRTIVEMPRSWVSDIFIAQKDLETRWPGGHKSIRYRRAELDRFAPYLRRDGLVTHLLSYKDLDCTQVVREKEWYLHRADHLEEREVDKLSGLTIERFSRGRRFHLLYHKFECLTPDGVHDMMFSNARVDCMVQRLETEQEMTETFEGRPDLLYYRHVVFGSDLQAPEDLTSDPQRRLLKVTERFHRNPAKPANEDVAERVFLLTRRRIHVRYHFQDGILIPSKRSFTKPRESTEQRKAEDFTPDLVSSFMVDMSEKPDDTLTLYQMLVSLMEDEESVVRQIRASLKEVRDVVLCRKEEEEDIRLIYSPWTSAGGSRAQDHREEMRHQEEAEQTWLLEKENDLLASLLVHVDDPSELTAEDARDLYQGCLARFKDGLVLSATFIQDSYEKETQELERKQQWFQKNQPYLTEEEEQEYQEFCSEKTLRIQVALDRLQTHKEVAPLHYLDLDQRLRQDPRLAPHL